MRKIFGDTFKLHSDDLRPVLICYDTNKLDAITYNPENYLKNEYPIDLTAGNISTSIDGSYVPHGVVNINNKKNSSGIWVWLSVTIPGIKSDYAKFVPAFSSANIDVPNLGQKRCSLL